MKFQIGQRVKIISNKHYNGIGHLIGASGHIIRYRRSDRIPYYIVEIYHNWMDSWYVYEDDMIPYDEKLNWFYEGGEG